MRKARTSYRSAIGRGDRGRRRRRYPSAAWLLFGTVMAGFAGVAAYAYVASPAVSVDHIRVTMAALPDAHEERAVASRLRNLGGTPIGRVRAESVRASLMRLPFVRDVQVSRRLPGSVHVAVKVREPMASLVCGGRQWEVDEDGVALRPTRRHSSLPKVVIATHPDVSAGRPVGSHEAVVALAALALSREVTCLKGARISVDQNAGICFNNPDNVAVCLGQIDDLPVKLALVMRIYDQDPTIAADIEAIDLSCPDAPACTPRKHAERSSRT